MKTTTLPVTDNAQCLPHQHKQTSLDSTKRIAKRPNKCKCTRCPAFTNAKSRELGILVSHTRGPAYLHVYSRSVITRANNRTLNLEVPSYYAAEDGDYLTSGTSEVRILLRVMQGRTASLMLSHLCADTLPAYVPMTRLEGRVPIQAAF
jgi:hypothetical protein